MTYYQKSPEWGRPKLRNSPMVFKLELRQKPHGIIGGKPGLSTRWEFKMKRIRVMPDNTPYHALNVAFCVGETFYVTTVQGWSVRNQICGRLRSKQSDRLSSLALPNLRRTVPFPTRGDKIRNYAGVHASYWRPGHKRGLKRD
jgi:hypothetical protein